MVEVSFAPPGNDLAVCQGDDEKRLHLPSGTAREGQPPYGEVRYCNIKP